VEAESPVNSGDDESGEQLRGRGLHRVNVAADVQDLSGLT
jgi:hypothetical protein